MEKKTSPTQLAFAGSVSIYRDDLEDIIARLNQTSKKVVIEDNKYRYASLDEVLEKQGPHPKQLSINSREPSVSFNVRIKRGWTTLGTSGDGDNLAPYFYIKEILESRKRGGLGFVLSGPQSVLFFVVMLGFLSMSTIIRNAIPQWFRWTYIIILMLESIVLGQLYNQGAFTTISHKKKHEEESFWSKNRDAVVVAIISSLVSAGLGFVVAYLLFRGGIK